MSRLFKKLINLRIKQLKLERQEFFEIQTCPNTFHHAKLCLAIQWQSFKIELLKALL